MKKILSLIIAFILIFSCFAVTVCASDVGFSIVEDKDYGYPDAYFDTQPVITFSEGFQKLYVDDKPFSRVDTSMLSTDFSYNVNISKNLTPWIKNKAYIDFDALPAENMKDLSIQTNEAQNMYLVEIQFNDGSSLIVTFLQDSYLEEYNKIISGDAYHYSINFFYPEENTVMTNKEALFGESSTLTKDMLYDVYDFFYVDMSNKDMSISKTSGVVFVVNESYFYLDYKEANIQDADLLFVHNYMNDDEEIPIHKISDAILISDITFALEIYYEDDFGLFYDQKTSHIIAAIFLILLFVVIPAIVFVIFLIKAIRSKGIYKKLYITVAVLCIAEIISFIILAITLYPFTSLSPSDTETILGTSDSVSIVVAKMTNIF